MYIYIYLWYVILIVKQIKIRNKKMYLIGDNFIMKCYNVDVCNVKTEADEALLVGIFSEGKTARILQTLH